MKQFRAEMQPGSEYATPTRQTLEHLITQHNALCDALEERVGEEPKYEYTLNGLMPKKTITLPKPEWWEDGASSEAIGAYVLALSDASKALGVEIRLEDTH